MSAQVVQVVTKDGFLGVPDNIGHVGWWSGSALPGSRAGATVIDGHVDSAPGGAGALAHITDLHSGDAVTVTTSNGHRFTYWVYARRMYKKAHGLPTSLFDGGGPPRLVLITCGGLFDASARSYQDNVAVFARPIG